MPGKIPERMNAFTVVINILSKKFKFFFYKITNGTLENKEVFQGFLR